MIKSYTRLFPTKQFAAVLHLHRRLLFTLHLFMSTFHLIVKGKVQGVFYRASAKEVADELGITGWVKNTTEGDVEILATGTKEQLDNFIAWCRVGPRRANVAEVIATEQNETFFDDFSVLR
jgi:acylphosphatase